MNVVAVLLMSLIGSDRLGDPTPPGVIARYGTKRLCLGTQDAASLRFHPTRDEVYATYSGGVIGWKLPGGVACFRDPGARDILFDPTGRSRLIVRTNESEVWNEATNRKTATIPHPPQGDCTPTDIGSGRVLATTNAFVGARGFARILEANARPTQDLFTCDSLRSMALSADGRRLWVVAADRGELRAHSADTGGLQSWRSIPFEPNADLDWTASANARRVVTVQFRENTRADRYRGFPECFIRVMDAATRRTEAQYDFRLDDTDDGLPMDESVVSDPFHSAYQTSDDGRFFAWMDSRNRLRIRHLPTGRVVTAPGTGKRNWAFHPTGARLAVLDRVGVLRLIDPHTGRFQHTAESPPTAASCTAVSPNGSRVVTGHACGEVWVWDAATGKPLWYTDAEPDGAPVREIHFNPTGTTVSAVGFWGPRGVRTWDAKTGRELGPMLPYQYFRTLAVSADAKSIADLIEEKSVMEDGKWAYPLFVRTRDVATGKELRRVRLEQRLGLSNETGAVVSRNGQVVVVAHTSGGSAAYDTSTGKRLCEMPNAHGGPLAASDDGRLVATATPSVVRDNWGDCLIQDTATGRAVATLAAPMSGRSALSFSRCDRYLMVQLDEPLGVLMFDLRGRQSHGFKGKRIAAFFPDGKSVVTLLGIRGAERVGLEPLAWKVAPPPKPDVARLNRLWEQLGEPDALNAVFELARHPAEAVPFLKSKLFADLPDPEVVAAHIGNLGAKLYTDREEATKALRALGPDVMPALRVALKADPSPEARSRLEKLIAFHADPTVPFTPARLRAVEALERCCTAGGRAALRDIATARTGTVWGDDAARAVKRE